MIIVKINKKLLKTAVIIILGYSLGLNVYNYIENIKIKYAYESAIRIVNQFDKSSLVSFLVSTDVLTQRDKNIEIFDINQGKVIKKVQPNPAIQKEVEGYLK